LFGRQPGRKPLGQKRALIDVAIVVSFCLSDEGADAEPANEGDASPDGDGATVMADTLSQALLNLAGISRSACSVHDLYAAVDRSRAAVSADAMS
jgi:hypothetical protein